MKLQNLDQRVPIARVSSDRTAVSQSSNSEPETVRDPFEEVSINRDHKKFATAYYTGQAVGKVLEGGGRAAQIGQVVGSVIGHDFGPMGSMLSMGAMAGGTFDVARGASIAQQSALNRNSQGCVLGGLQMAQGLASWGSAIASMCGAPGVSRVASAAALAALAGRVGYNMHLKHSASRDGEDKHSVNSKQALDVSSKANEFGSGINRLLDISAEGVEAGDVPVDKEKPAKDKEFLTKSLGAAQAVNKFASDLGNVGAFYNNFQAIRGNGPDNIWGPIGAVGGTYQIAMGAATVRRAAVNHHGEDTFKGLLDMVGGAASVTASLGIGGRIAPGVAVGAFIGKNLYGFIAPKKRHTEEGPSVEGHVWNNLKTAFTPVSKETTTVAS